MIHQCLKQIISVKGFIHFLVIILFAYIVLVDLYKRTFNPLKADVEAFIYDYGAQIGWQKWVDKWNKLSVNDFLRTTIGAELTCIYRPWPEIAIRGYQVVFYQFDPSFLYTTFYLMTYD